MKTPSAMECGNGWIITFVWDQDSTTDMAYVISEVFAADRRTCSSDGYKVFTSPRNKRDALIQAESAKKGQTYVVRKPPKRKGEKDRRVTTRLVGAIHALYDDML